MTNSKRYNCCCCGKDHTEIWMTELKFTFCHKASGTHRTDELVMCAYCAGRAEAILTNVLDGFRRKP